MSVNSLESITLYKSSQELLYVILYFNIVQLYKQIFLKEQFQFILFEHEPFQIYFGRATTFSRIFDRVVGLQENDLRLCVHLLSP